MKTMTKKLAELIDVKTIITVVVIIIFSVLALRGDIPADSVMLIVTMVVSFYFGTQHQKKVANATEETVKAGEE